MKINIKFKERKNQLQDENIFFGKIPKKTEKELLEKYTCKNMLTIQN